MTISHEQRYKPKVNSVTYYQRFLASAAILVFYTRLDIYLQDMGFGLPLYWMFGFLAASVL